jgi:Fe-S cluster assembly protein SufD
MTMHQAIARTAAETTLAAQFATLATGDADRIAAFATFAAEGLPTRRNEDWHYTDLRSAMAKAAPLAPAPDAGRIEAARVLLATHERVGDVRFVLVDGRFVAELSDPAPAGLSAEVLGKSPRVERTGAVMALNDAFAAGGLSLTLDERVDFAHRIEIVHCAHAGAPQSAYSRVSVTLPAGARGRIFERFIGAGRGYQRNALTRLSLSGTAKASIVTLIDDDAGLHLETQIARLGAGAEFNAFALVAGGALVRRQILVRHDAAAAKIALGGLSLLDGKRHADTTLIVEHAAPRGQSREYYRHIVADEATGVYQGKVVVEPHAQKTDGGMKSQAILVSPTAMMNNKPELEIFADDVVCGHGATVGALDPEQLFYCEARGIPRAEAEALLLEAFGADAIDRVEDAEMAEALRERMRAWLAARGEKQEAKT